MLLYAVADVHSRDNRIDILRRNVIHYKPDLLIIAGDLTRWFNPRPTLEKIADIGIETLFVRGNTDAVRTERILADFPNISSPHLVIRQIDGYSFTGLNGTIPIPFRSQINLLESWTRTLDPILTSETILIAHPPPRGTLDSVFFKLHAGCPKIREVILRNPPMLYICGHIHESAGIEKLGETLVVNCSIGKSGQGALVELEPGRIKHVEML